MKSAFKFLGIMVIMSVAVFSLTVCDTGGGGGGGGTGGGTNPFIGAWTGTDPDGFTIKISITGSTFTLSWPDDPSFQIIFLDSNTGTYTYSGNTATLRGAGNTVLGTANISGTTITVIISLWGTFQVTKDVTSNVGTNPFIGTWTGVDPDGDIVNVSLANSTFTLSWPDYPYFYIDFLNSNTGTYTYTDNTATVRGAGNVVLGTASISGSIITVNVDIWGTFQLSKDSIEWSPSLPVIEMVQIPGGTFTMGSPESEIGRILNETQWEVTLSAFRMSKYQVTQEQWRAVMGNNPSSFKSKHGYLAAAGEVQRKRPVENVSWYDTIVFCNRLSIMEGLTPAYRIGGSTNPDVWGIIPASWADPLRTTWDAVSIVSGSTGYRLPTEAQWEYACRAGTTTAFSNGTQDWNDGVQAIAWYGANSGSMTHEVGKKAPNAYGLYDMHGNGWEWCWDWYGTYPTAAGTDPTGAPSGSARVLRSGYLGDSAQYLRSAFRNDANPSYRLDRGFRLVRP